MAEQPGEGGAVRGPGAAILELDEDKTLLHLALNHAAIAEWAQIFSEAAHRDAAVLGPGTPGAEALATELNRSVLSRSEVAFAEVSLDERLTHTSSVVTPRRSVKETAALLACGSLILIVVAGFLRGVAAFLSDINVW